MRFTRYKYHWAIKIAKRDRDKAILNSTALQLENKSFKEFWKTIRKLRGNNKISSNIVDDIGNDQGIADNFKHIYNDLFNSVTDNDFNNVVKQVDNLVSTKCNSNACTSLP